MSITNGYCTLAELKAALDITDTDDDALLEAAINAVSRQIDAHCHRRFYANTEDETRYFTALDSQVCFTDDLVAVTTLATDPDGDRSYAEIWAATDYDLCPANAALDGEPYTWLEVTPEGDYVFPTSARGVKIVGKFGYASTTPAAVKQACLIQCARLFKRKDAPFGVVGAAEMGQLQVIPSLDPDVKVLLASFVKESR